ncbi:VOC family protein [Streptomyces sp. CA-250714]|uniref:VOC family protein n=1 Tax=Streptomyces sp. CA-250714 TaxID=3240060 RepID=UPI003D912F56
MTFRDSPWPEGTPCWVEVRVAEPVRTSTFYAALFGWTFFDHGAEYDHYLTARLDGRAVADIGPRPATEAADAPPAWLVCFAARSVDAVAAKIVDAGGKVLLPPDDVGTHGRFAVAADPAGAEFAVWQAYAYPGAEVTGVAGATVWHHCASQDVEASLAFYAEVFGHTVTRSPAGQGAGCTTLDLDGRPVASVGEPSPGSGHAAPSRWEVTFGVGDLAAALTQVTELGGATLDGPFETSHGMCARVTDAQGTAFDLLEVSADG